MGSGGRTPGSCCRGGTAGRGRGATTTRPTRPSDRGPQDHPTRPAAPADIGGTLDFRRFQRIGSRWCQKSTSDLFDVRDQDFIITNLQDAVLLAGVIPAGTRRSTRPGCPGRPAAHTAGCGLHGTKPMAAPQSGGVKNARKVLWPKFRRSHLPYPLRITSRVNPPPNVVWSRTWPGQGAGVRARVPPLPGVLLRGRPSQRGRRHHRHRRCLPHQKKSQELSFKYTCV